MCLNVETYNVTYVLTYLRNIMATVGFVTAFTNSFQRSQTQIQGLFCQNRLFVFIHNLQNQCCLSVFLRSWLAVAIANDTAKAISIVYFSHFCIHFVHGYLDDMHM